MSEKDIEQKDKREVLTKSDESVEPIEEKEDLTDAEKVETETVAEKKKNKLAWLITLAIIAVVALGGLFWIVGKRSGQTEVTVKTEEKDEHTEGETEKEVKLDTEALESAKIETEGVTQRPAIALLKTTGAVENDPQKTQSITPLVGGRIERVNVAVGDYVQTGSLLAFIASPQVAQLHGKMHEAETRLELAERNLARVQKSENRVAVLQAKAKLDEADATLKRTRRLIELGAGAGKDLIAAETNYKTAKAEYDFQSNISLNKEIQEAKAEVETARVDLSHIRNEMTALGVKPNERDDDHNRDTSQVPVYSTASGVITERFVNSGAGIEAGKTLFTISNLSSVWIVANVPESQMILLRVGTGAEIRSAAIGKKILNARITYIDPQLSEDTRTGRVRLDVPNPTGNLRAGMFVEVGFQTGTGEATGEELVVPTIAIQRIGEKNIVFIPKEDEPGAFEVREIETGGEVEEYTRVISGLKLGEVVVTKGSFTLKTQLQKGEMGEHGH